MRAGLGENLAPDNADKLHQCYPGSRYFATDTSADGAVAAPTRKRASKAAGSTTPAKRAARKVAAPAESGDA